MARVVSFKRYVLACAQLVLLCCTALAPLGPVGAAERPIVLVVGGSGDTGLEMMRAAAAAKLQPRGMTRDRDRARQAHPQYDWVQADARDPQAVALAMRDVQFVLCAIGAPAFEGPNAPQFVDYQGVATVVDAAAAAGVRHFVLISSGSAGPHREPRKTPRLNFVLLWKTFGENHLKASGIPYTIIGPGGLMPGEPGRNGLAITPRLQYQSANVARADVARVALDALTNPAARNKSFALVNSDNAQTESWRQQLAALPPDIADPTAIENLAWLAGHWTRAVGGSTSEEIWLPADAGIMLGMSRNVAASGRREFEFMRIEERADGAYFVASPGGGPSTDFKLAVMGESTVTFTNAAHDFPNKISYARRGNELSATIEGLANGKPASASWTWSLQESLRVPYLPPASSRSH
jgi:uncharacterized protein YbjT (DUF2867 family)